MGSALPEIPEKAFRRGLLAACIRLELPTPQLELQGRLFAHYEELRRWNQTVALVGPGMPGEALEQHYAESLAGLALIPDGADTLVDIGSGAGFPALVLAAATNLAVTLIEVRERKAAFLRAAARRMSLRVTCLSARVESLPLTGLPAQIDVITMRAVRFTPALLQPLLPRLSERGRILLWTSAEQSSPPALELLAEKALLGQRRIVALRNRP